jgi:Flp pilus assembly protein TadD
LYNRPDGSNEAYAEFQRGISFLNDGHPHQAAMSLSRAKLAEPEKGSIREALGRALLLAGRATRARMEFAKAVSLDPVNDYAHFGLALACERTGQRVRARAHIKLALAMKPDDEHYRRALLRLDPR